ncbi:MAG: ABC transporter ATP-binding protein [Myxococcales bacterium]
MPELALDMRGVSKRFGATPCLEQLDLSVPMGAVFGFLGPNGAGKTTTLRILLGLVRIDAGTVRVLGADPAADGQSIRQQVGVLLESDGLYDRLTAVDNLAYHARIHHLNAATRAQRMEELLRSFGLWERREDRVLTWSKGMRQKLAIARALLHRPRLLLLDEPFAGLDPVAAHDLRDRIAALAREERVTVVLTTHDLAHVEKICSEVALLDRGRVIATGAPDRLVPESASIVLRVAGLGLGEDVLAALRRDRFLSSYRMENGGAQITCARDGRQRLSQELVARGVVVEEMFVVKDSLEAAFVSLLRAGKGEKPP